MRFLPHAVARRGFVIAAIAFSVGTAGPCLAAPTLPSGAPSPPAWSSIDSVGDKRALCRLAGINEQIDDARLPLELIRVIHGERLTGPEPADRTRLAVVGYLSTIDDFVRALGPSPPAELSTGAMRTHARDLRALLKLLGIEFDQKSPAPWRDLPRRSEAIRQVLSDAGLPLQNLVARLNQGEKVSLILPRIRVPLPLVPATWRDVVFRNKVPDDSLFPAVVRDRTAALLYHGLASLDAETLAYFGTRRDLMSLAREHPGAFAATARSIHVRGGRVLVPGGSPAEPEWTALVAAPPSDASAFIRSLLRHPGAYLPYFYDAVSHFPPGQQQFALGLVGSRAPGSVRFRALYDAFAGAVPSWSLEEHPFTRPTPDGVMLFTLLGVTDQGDLTPPSSAAFWNCALGEGTLPTDEAMRSQSIAAQPAADAATMAGLVLRPGSGLQRAQRLRAVLFGQRVFARRPPQDAPIVCAAVRGFVSFEALALVLERMGLDDPRTYLSAMRRALEISDIGDARTAAVVLSQFQGAMALVDRLVFEETLDAAQSARLIESLVELPLTNDGYRGALAGWLRTDLVPAIRRGASDSTAPGDEDVLLEALAGIRPVVAAPPTPVEWEGQRYRVDPASAELARLLNVRRKQAGTRLDDPLALYAIAAALADPKVPVPERRRLVDRLATLVHAHPVEDVADGDARAPVDRSLARVSDAAARLAASPESDGRRATLAERLATATDEMLAAVLRSLAYATAIGSPDTNLFLGPDVAQDHEFGAADSRWAIAVEQAGNGVAWHLRGSLLALDVPLARYSLRRVANEQPLAPRRLDSDDQEGLALSAVLKRPWALTDVGRDRIVALLNRGRQEAAAAATPEARATLFDLANVSEWRRNLLEWRATQPASLESTLTLTELMWVGARLEHTAPPDAWGASMVALSGCLCLRMIGPGSIDTFGIRPSLGTMSSYSSDATLRVAELTAELDLPAAIVAPLLTGITQDVLDAAQTAHGDDYLELAQAARSLTRERFEDQVAALTVAGGPLVPVGEGGNSEVRSQNSEGDPFEF